MSIYALAPFIAAILNFVLVLWVFLQAPAGRIRRTFIAWNIVLGIWNLVVMVGYVLPTAELASWWYKWIAAPPTRFIAALFLDFVTALTGEEENSQSRRVVRW